MANRQKFDKGNRLASRMENISIQDDDRALSSSNKIHHLLIDKIQPNPYQPRINIEQDELEELKDSITKNGLIQPITVSKTQTDTFIVVAGHRRLEAHKQLNKETIEAIITSKSDEELKYLVLLENLQRKDLDPLELAITYNILIKDMTQEKLAEKVSKSQSHVSRTLNLLKLSEEIQQEIYHRTYTNIKVLNALNNIEKIQQKEILDEIRGLSTENALNAIRELFKSEKEEPESFEFTSNKNESLFTIKIDLKNITDKERKNAVEKLEEVILKLSN